MLIPGKRIEVMKYLGGKIDSIVTEYLKRIDTNWQPADFLPVSNSESFMEEIKELQGACRELPYDYLAVLVGDAITEEALPSYESWLMCVDGVNQEDQSGWSRWIRGWTAEEKRHGDLLNKYLYLSGRVNMQQMEVSTQYLIADGFDIQTGTDPYRNFVYTSFQELATNISHRRTATLAKKHGNNQLSKICGVIAADEMRHAKAYMSFISEIIQVDASELLLAFEDMMRKKIAMPAHFMRETGMKIGETFSHFSDAAQRIGVYTTFDYIDILKDLLIEWRIDSLNGLTDMAEKSRDYLMALPDRFSKVALRSKTPSLQYHFNWILP